MIYANNMGDNIISQPRSSYLKTTMATITNIIKSTQYLKENFRKDMYTRVS